MTYLVCGCLSSPLMHETGHNIVQSLLVMKFGKTELVAAGLAVSVFLVAVVPFLRHFNHQVPSAPVAYVTVTQRDRHFYPNRLTIVRGTVVHILNQDHFIHHVYVKSSLMNLDSGDDPIGVAINVEFDHPGTYDVRCAIHPLMHLWVTVD